MSNTLNDEVDSEAPDDEATEPQSEKDRELLEQARKHYRLCEDADSENRTAALADLSFLIGGENQWDPIAVTARKADGRPMITVNTLPTYLHQVTNDQRQNSPSIKVHPVNEGADQETAKVRQGMIRHIEYDSNADVAYDRSVNSAAAVGFGYWRLVTEYESETSFNQKIMYKSIRNALSVRIDPLSTEPDGSDMTYCFIESMMARDEFKRQYPKANASTWPLGDSSVNMSGWLSDNTVLVCEYYCIEKESVDVVQLSDGTSGFKDKIIPDGDEKRLPEGLTVVGKRTGIRCKVMWYKITAVDVLEQQEIKCKWIPVFPVYGDEIDIEGKVIRSGIIRHAKGPAQMYNVMITSATEEIGLRTKSPYMMAEGQEEGHEDEFQQANARAFPYLTYKPVTLDGNLAPPPQRQPMADFPVGSMQMAMHARDNIKATTGLFDSSLGNKGNATSGIQEREQQHQGEVANFHFTDGLLRTLRHCGRCIDYMIPHYYDSQRIVAIMAEDGSVEHAEINAPNVDQEKGEDGEIRDVLNDMTGGEYTATVESGPNYTTMREESAQFFTKAIQAAKDPRMAAVITYLAVKYQDIPGAEEAAEMLEKLLPPEVQKPPEGQEEMIQTPKGPLPVSQVPQALQSLDQQVQQLQEQLQKANADKQAMDAAKAQESLLKQQNMNADQQLAPQRANTDALKAQADHEAAIAAHIQAEADLIRARLEAETAPAKANAELAKLNSDAATAEATRLQAERDAHQAQTESNISAAPTLDEIKAMVEQMRPPINGMQIKAPSGQVYEVSVQ